MNYLTGMKALFICFSFVVMAASGCRTGQHAAASTASLKDTSYVTSTGKIKGSYIPDSVFELKELKHLSITGMDCDYREIDAQGKDITQCWGIDSIPAAIAGFTRLETLSLPVNGIQSIPQALTELSSLKLLDLSDNVALSDTRHLPKLVHLEELYLYGCHLKELPEGIGNLTHLKTLGLTGNQFSPEEIKRIRQSLPHCKIIIE